MARNYSDPMQALEALSRGSRHRWDDPLSNERQKYAGYMRRSLHKRWHVKRDLVNPDCEFCR